ncbi:MAG: peptide chain release factor-like protein [Nitrospiria bacterium]
MMTEKEKRPQKNTPSGKRADGETCEPIPGPRYAVDLETLKNVVTVHTFRASGPGGQHRNVTDSGVRLVHPPSGVVVTATESRSQIRNKEKAFERLIKRLAELNRVQKRRIPSKKSRAVRARELQEKERRRTKKRMREKPGLEGE